MMLTRTISSSSSFCGKSLLIVRESHSLQTMAFRNTSTTILNRHYNTIAPTPLLYRGDSTATISLPLLQHQQQQHQRQFSSRRNHNQPLKNAALIQELVKQSGQLLPPSAITVRLVVDRGLMEGREPMTICTLEHAIQTCLEWNLDLFGVQLKQDPPVLRAQQQHSSSQKKGQSESEEQTTTPNYSGKRVATAGKPQQQSLPMKEIKFKAGIGDNDLQRKVQNVLKYLEKGHYCQLTLMASKFKLANDEHVLTKTLNQIKEIVGPKGEIIGKLKSSREGGLISMTMVPSSSTNKDKSKATNATTTETTTTTTTTTGQPSLLPHSEDDYNNDDVTQPEQAPLL